ncbi:MAG: class I SAM-dependent methyltransferase [Euryarchaeota archaeon]|tara:strand:+ start:1637 stop:2437 length:801 start_codon:yes stop_codon:yes gene_type:complete
MSAEKYHKSVADYYDEEAESFESRANDNHVLMTLRNKFRQLVLRGEVEHLLEIGYGPGLDMVWFADAEGVETVNGLDITPEFHKIVSRKAEKMPKMNPLLGGPEDSTKYLEANSIDTIYVFFGALNTCAELEKAVAEMSKVLKPGGRIVATFVNKWYAFDIIWNLMMLRPKKAIARLRGVWGGYSPTRFLASKCYSSRQIHRFFRTDLKKKLRLGYCITHPAWYRHHWAPYQSLRSKFLYALDSVLQWTPFWNLGEYSLYVYEKPE